VDDGRWRGVATIARPWGQNAYVIASGYREAAEALVDHVLQIGYHEDFLVYPVMFLFRQSVELRLKQIAVASSRLAGTSPPLKDVLGRHELDPIWRICRESVERLEGGPVSDLDNAERTLAKLTWADRASFSFRYAADKSGEPLIPNELEAIDLARVRSVMAGVLNLLDGIRDFIDVMQEAENDWQAELHDGAG
jgi:hypothetical protein